MYLQKIVYNDKGRIFPILAEMLRRNCRIEKAPKRLYFFLFLLF